MTDKPKKPFVRDNGEGGKHVKTLTMERLKDGTQQYIRGDTPGEKIRNANNASDNYLEKDAYLNPALAGKLNRVAMDYADGGGKDGLGQMFEDGQRRTAKVYNRIRSRKTK